MSDPTTPTTPESGAAPAGRAALPDRRHVVTAPRGATVRAAPSRRGDPVRRLACGQVVSVDYIVGDGEAVPSLSGQGTSKRWAVLIDGGYVWAEHLRPHGED